MQFPSERRRGTMEEVESGWQRLPLWSCWPVTATWWRSEAWNGKEYVVSEGMAHKRSQQGCLAIMPNGAAIMALEENWVQ